MAVAKKKNKQRRLQKKKQAKALKNQRRRKEFLKANRTIEETVIHWDNLNFLEEWKSLKPFDLMQNCFQFTVEEWVTQWVRPKRDRDFNALHHQDSLADLLHQTFDNTLDAWSDDTKGFTENLPDRWQYNQKNKNRFITLMKASLETDDEITDEDIIQLMENDRPEWFSTVFAEMLDDMVDTLVPYVMIELKSISFDS